MISTQDEGRPMERLYDNGKVRAFLDAEAGEAYVEVRDGAAGWAARRAVEWLSNYGLYPRDPTGAFLFGSDILQSESGPVRRHYCVPLGFGTVG